MFINDEYFWTDSEMSLTCGDYVFIVCQFKWYLVIQCQYQCNHWCIAVYRHSTSTVNSGVQQWNNQRSVFSVKIGTFARMLNFSLQILVGVESEHQWCLKIIPCTPVVVLDDDNVLVFPCAVGYCRNPILGLLCFRLEFHISTDNLAYRPWVSIPASQGWVTLEPHRTLEAKHPFAGGRLVMSGRFEPKK